MGTLGGKVAIVTGAPRGIGRAIAERLGRDGARVVVNYVQNTGKAQEVVEAVEGSGSQAVAVQADIGRREDAQRLFRVVEERFGGVDVVINNASISAFKPHVEVSEEEFDQVFVEQAVNMTPRGRLGQPEDVVAFLVSDDGRWMTGQLVRAGGGLM